MTQYMISYIHVDETDEERCICKFIWDPPNPAVAKERAEAIRQQVTMDAAEDYDCDLDPEQIHINVVTLQDALKVFQRRGRTKMAQYFAVQKYAFVKEGAKVFWNDPDSGNCSGPRIVKKCTFYYDEDSTVLLTAPSGQDETEVPYAELIPSP